MPRFGSFHRRDTPGNVRGRLLEKSIGIGFRPQIAADLLGDQSCADFVEIIAERCFALPEARREPITLSDIWPVLPYGVKLSLGSAEGIDDEHARELGTLAPDRKAPFLSEHVAFVRAGGREIGHLTQLPRTREAVRVVARNVARARRRLPDIPLLLENVAFGVLWPEDKMDEPSFYAEIVEATGCLLQLDVANLYANAIDEGKIPSNVLASDPVDRVTMVHLAGGTVEEGLYFDTHAHPVPEPVVELLRQTLQYVATVPVRLERDGGFGNFAEIRGELERMRTVRPSTTPNNANRKRVSNASPAVPNTVESPHDLAIRQVEVARLFTDAKPAKSPLATSLGAAADPNSRNNMENGNKHG